MGCRRATHESIQSPVLDGQPHACVPIPLLLLYALTLLMTTSQTRVRRRAERAALDAALLEAAARADESGVKAALARGADMNAVDNATGNTAVTYAIAGDRCGRFCCVRVVCREC